MWKSMQPDKWRREEFTKRFAQEELSMKKLGFLPRDFNLKEFLVKSTGQEIAAYYDDETKMISMLNWVPPDRQEPILAHELTHALQDQNYDLAKWMKAGRNGAIGSAIDDSAIARKAVVEGQAMVVYVDYLLKPVGRSLEDTAWADLPDGRAGGEGGDRFPAHARCADDPARVGNVCL